MKKIICFLLAIIFLSEGAFAINLSAKSAILIDADSGRVLYEKNAYEKLPMASTTKIMTGLLACESKKMKDIVTVSAVASGTEGSSLWLKIGEKQTLENLTYGLMLKSGNDAATAIAEHLCGSVDAFALKMTMRAKEIGAKNTQFKNANGLDSDGHYTTAYDLAEISREAMKNKMFKKIVSTKNYSIPLEGEEWDRALTNHNKMLWRYEGCNGIKTGYTKKCGRCLVTSAERDGKLICVTLNAPDDWNDHKKLLDMGFSDYKKEQVYKKGERVTKYIYDKKKNKSVPLVSKEEISVMKKENEKLEIKIEYKKAKPPIKKNTVLAVAHIFIDGNRILEMPLVNNKEVKKTGNVLFK